jgi:hypothetical protein
MSAQFGANGYAIEADGAKQLSAARAEIARLKREAADLEALVRGYAASCGDLSAELNARRLSSPLERTPEQLLAFEDRLFRVLGIVGGLGFWEAWRLPMVCRELRFGFSGGGAPADMIKLGLEKRGVWAKLREARAARRDEDGGTQFDHACYADVEDVQRACELLELGWPGSVDARTGAGWTPLMVASSRGHAGIVKALLAAGADVNAASDSGMTALIYACSNGHLESARLLVAAKALVNVRDAGGNTPLNCSRGFYGATANPAIEALLLAAGATAV